MNLAKLGLNPGNLGWLGSRTHVTWVSWVLARSEPSSKGFVALAMNPADPAKT